jgi:hypothetical protein
MPEPHPGATGYHASYVEYVKRRTAERTLVDGEPEPVDEPDMTAADDDGWTVVD